MKPKKQRPGRRKFSAGKLLGPDNSLDQNINLAAIGEFALDKQSQAIFGLVALWQKWHTLPPEPAGERYDRARKMLQARRDASANEKLLNLLKPALDSLDPKPFKIFMNAIEAVRDINAKGALTPLAYVVLCVVVETGLLDENMKPNPNPCITFLNFQKQVDRRLPDSVDDRWLRRLCKLFKISFMPDKRGRKPGQQGNK